MLHHNVRCCTQVVMQLARFNTACCCRTYEQSPYSVQFRNGTVDVEARNGDGFPASCKYLYYVANYLNP
jgi:hypothetical protein